jgi:hypothetical protein
MFPVASASAPLLNVELEVYLTTANTFGLIREYHGRLPFRDPEDDVALSELTNIPASRSAPSVPASEVVSLRSVDKADVSRVPTTITPEMYFPYENHSTALLHTWYWRDSRKSKEDLDYLVKKVLQNEEFNSKDVKHTGLAAVNIKPSEHDLPSVNDIFKAADGWRQRSVPIDVPFGKRGPPATYMVRDLYYWSPLEIMRTICESDAVSRFHFDPYLLFWQPSDGTPQQEVQGEFYTSREFMEAHEDLLKSAQEPGCTLPRAIVALLIGSDSTRVAQFGTASLWPSYIMFGNESKYTRGRPSAHAIHHMAYFPKACFISSTSPAWC